MRISPVDLLIIVAYLAGVTLFGAMLRRGQQTVRDYFLGGRTTPWWALACSIVATETSTLTIIGTPAIAYAGNLGFLQLVLGYVLARIILCVVLVPQYFQGEFYTAYQLLEKRFGRHMKRAASAVFLATRALAEGVRISAIGKVFSVAFGFGDRASIAAITAMTIFYTFEGGMRAVIWTDVMQFALYILGSITAFFVLLHKIPGGWTTVTHAAAAAGGKFNMFDFGFSLTQSYTFWSGLIGGTFLTMASHGVDQTIVQRLLAARSERESKIALISSGFIVLVQFALFLVIGVMLFVFAQHYTLPIPEGDPDRIFPSFIVHYMPVGVVGIVLASIFAVAMSNASGSLNSLASSTVMDFGGHHEGDAKGGTSEENQEGSFGSPLSRPSLRMTSKHGTTLRRSRLITLLWGLVLGFLGLVRWGGVLVAGLTIASITYGGLLGVFLLGTWNKRANQTGALVGFTVGIATMVVVNRLTPLAFTWYVLAGTIVTFTVGSVASAFANSGRRGALS